MVVVLFRVCIYAATASTDAKRARTQLMCFGNKSKFRIVIR